MTHIYTEWRRLDAFKGDRWWDMAWRSRREETLVFVHSPFGNARGICVATGALSVGEPGKCTGHVHVGAVLRLSWGLSLGLSHRCRNRKQAILWRTRPMLVGFLVGLNR